MNEVAPGGKVQVQNTIARLDGSKKYGLVCLGARMRLYVGVSAIEQLASSVNGNLFDDVNNLTASVKTISWITFQRFIGHRMSEHIQHRRADDVFRRD